MKLIKLIPFFLILFLIPSVLAVVSHTLNAPDDLFETTDTGILFNWTAISTINTSIESRLYVSNFSNEEQFLLNQSLTCTNSTSCNVTVSGFQVGFYQWRLISTDDANATNYSSSSRWFEIQQTNNASLFKWENESGFIAMTLNKNTGDLNVTGGAVIGGNLNLSGNLSIGDKITFALGEMIDNIVDGWLRLTGNVNVTQNLTVNNFATIPNLVVTNLESNMDGSGFTVILNRLNSTTVDTTNLEADNLETNLDGTGFNITASWFLGFLNWSNVQNKFIETVDNVYIYMSGTNLTFNETKLNNSIDARAPLLNVNSSNYWDGFNTPVDLTNRILSDWLNISNVPTHLTNFTDNLNYSNKNVNSSNYWDNLNVPADLNNLILLDWANITNKFITAVSGVYLYMTGTTLYFNDTLLNATFQKEVGANCAGGDFASGIYDNGTLVCGTPAGGGDITGVDTFGVYLSGGALTGLANLTFNDTLLNATFQKEVGSDCTGGQVVSGIYNNGTLVCTAAGSGDITAVYTGDNLLLGGGATGDINLTFNTTALTSNIGNWSADKSSYATTTHVNSLGNFSAWSGVVNAVNVSAGVYPAGNFRYQGHVNMTNNNVTSVDCIIFKSGGKLCDSP